MKFNLPKEVLDIVGILQKDGCQAFLVGGCLRDLILERKPKDWDIATDAEPTTVLKLFETFNGRTKKDPATVYENNFGTVGIKTGSDIQELKIIEVTTFRIEGKYTDKRHPDEVKFAKTIEEDLARRDFTMNAIALNLLTYNLKLTDDLIDPFDGLTDIGKKIIRTVEDPERRFEEDALRLMRATRFYADLGFDIEEKTMRAIKDKAGLLEMISEERVRDEIQKMIMTPRAAGGIIMLEDTGLLRYVIPELREGIGCGQNKHHIYTVFDHNVRALNYTAEKNYSFIVRLASLLHDVGKPKTKRGEGENSTFYNHEVVGAKMTVRILDRLKFPKDIVEQVTHLVRHHLFYYNVGEVTEAGVRRFLNRVGPEYIDDLIKVREADRIGSGVPKAFPYKLRHLLFMIEKVKHDPIHPKMLKINGNDLMSILKIEPGPKVGMILYVLLEDVLDDPKRNTEEYLRERAKELGGLSEKELKKLSKKAQEKKDEAESGIEEEMKKKYYVK